MGELITYDWAITKARREGRERMKARKRERLPKNLTRMCNRSTLQTATIARDLGIHPNTLWNYMRGKTPNPGIFTVLAIADYFDIKVEELFQ